MKRIVAALMLLCGVAAVAARGASTEITGWISDDMCGAKHAGSGAACVKQCMKSGMKPVFVDEQKKAVWTIENPDAVKDFYGEHVAIKAEADAAKHSVKIEAIAKK